MKPDRRERVIVALDVPNKTACEKLVHQLQGKVKYYKIGSELFTNCGYEAINLILENGAKVFLDLKLYDIPNTVDRASRIISRLGVDMFNVHASGGKKMMGAARIATEEECQENTLQKPLILGVTILTSFTRDEIKEIYGAGLDLEQKVLQFATNVKEAGLDGVIASAKEVSMIKEKLGSDFVVVTPGIRPQWSKNHDQKRVTTPKEAFDMGSDYIVMGRTITQAPNPEETVERIFEELG